MAMIKQNIDSIRRRFPALCQEASGSAPVFLDGTGGTQVPRSVLEAMSGYLEQGNSNLSDSPFFAVQKTREIVRQAREKAAAFLNVPDPQTVIFGANMTTLTAHLSRSIAEEWQAGDEIIVTDLDHFANVSFWVREAQRRSVRILRVPINKESFSLDVAALEKLISPKTRLIAFTLASNACGSKIPASAFMEVARSCGALVFIDAVHYVPHFLPDFQALDPDFMICSAYKFFGPHLGFCAARPAHLERLRPYKVGPAPDSYPECWETGTKSFEDLAGLSAAIDYLASLGEGKTLRTKLANAYGQIYAYEREWAGRFLDRARSIKGLRIWGEQDPALRTPTFALTMKGHSPLEISNRLAEHNISAGSGHFYATGFTDTFGLTDKGGVLRAGAMHYNSFEEINRFFDVLEGLGL